MILLLMVMLFGPCLEPKRRFIASCHWTKLLNIHIPLKAKLQDFACDLIYYVNFHNGGGGYEKQFNNICMQNQDN